MGVRWHDGKAEPRPCTLSVDAFPDKDSIQAPSRPGVLGSLQAALTALAFMRKRQIVRNPSPWEDLVGTETADGCQFWSIATSTCTECTMDSKP